MKKNTYTAFLASLLLFSSCQKILIGNTISNTPTHNFQEFWKGYDQYCGLFNVNHLNWDSVYTDYMPKINDQMNNRQLYIEFSNMIRNFNNIHVFLQPTSDQLPRFESSRFYATHKIQEDFKIEVVKKYFPNLIAVNQSFNYGVSADNIGYINFGDFGLPVSFYSKQLEAIMNKLKDTKGIILDIRNHEGGDDKVGKYIAGLFASEQKLFMTVRKKNGPGHNDFTDFENWYVNKEGSFQYTKPVILLTSRWTASAGETFTWAMKTQYHVKQIGDTTAGGFSDVSTRELPNGWLYFVPVGDYRNSKGQSEEGKGIVPDVLVSNTKDEIDLGKDKMLETAINRLK